MPVSAVVAREGVFVGGVVGEVVVLLGCVLDLVLRTIHEHDPLLGVHAGDEAADLICEAIRSKPKQINTRLGTFGEVAYALAPKAVDQILHMAFKVFPDSAAAKGEKDPDEKASMEQVAMANLMKGVHW